MSNIDDYLQQAHEGMEHFERTDDPSLLSTDLLQKILAHPDFSSLPRHLQHATFASAGAKTLERLLRSADGDLDLTIELLQRAIQLANTHETPPAIEFNRLAIAFHYRHDQTKDPEDLAKAIEFWRRAVAVVPFDSIRKGIWLANLSNGLRTRYAHYHDEKAVDEAIECCREAEQLVGSNVVAHLNVIRNLAEGLGMRYTYAKSQADIDEAILLYRKTISVTKAGDRVLGPLQNNLGQCLFSRYQETKNPTDLDESIRSYDEALTLTQDDLFMHGKVVVNLLFAFRERYLLAGNMVDLECSISCAMRSLELESLNVEVRATRLQTFGQLLRMLYDKSGDPQHLDFFLQCYSEAIRLLPLSSTSLSSCLCDLGDGLRRRHMLTNNTDDLDAAMNCHERALQHAAKGSLDHGRALNGLGTCLGQRYEKTSSREDLDKAVEAFRQGLAVAIDTHVSGAADCASNLGNCLRLRYGRTGDISDLTWAIQVGQQALTLGRPDSPGRAMFASNLGNSLREYYAHTNDRSHLNEAIDLFQQAVNSPTCAVSDRPIFLTNLGLTLRQFYDVTGQVTDLDRAIEYCRQAVSLTPESSGDEPIRLTNLGVSLVSRYQTSKTLPDLEEAITRFEQTLRATPENAPSRAHRLGNLADSWAILYSHTGDEGDIEQAARLWSEACEEGAKVDPATVLYLSQTWGNSELKRKNWTQAIKAFSYGTQAIDQLYKAQMLRPNKEAWLHKAQKLAHYSAYAHARGGDLVAAVRQLEGGRARLLADSVEHARVELEKLPQIGYSELYERYKTATTHIKELEEQLSREDKRSNRDLTSEWLASRSALNAVIADIQEIPGYEDFFSLPGFDLIRNTLTHSETNGDQSVGIYFTVSAYGGLALIVHVGGIEPIWLELVETDLSKLLLGETKTDGYLATLLEGTQSTVKLDQVLSFFAERIYRPVADALLRVNGSRSPNQNISSLILIPTGLLSVFPLHAPFYLNDDCILRDDVSVSYVPSARALRYCQSNLQSYNSKALVPTLLAVGNPLPVPEGWDSLPFALAEVEQCARFFPERAECLVEDEATFSAVLSRIAQANYLQFSCHGHFTSQEPLNAGILLSGGERLTVADLLHMRGLNSSRLVILSACQTALSDFIKVPEEAVGLPSSFLQIGVPGVIGSLWPVNDLSTALLMTKFYECHLLGDPSNASNGPMTPARALRRAQLWLRDLSRSELAALLDTLNENGGGQRSQLGTIVRHPFVEGALKTNDQRPFSDPFYWAPFVMYGV
jgi:CHAT domain-containing protein/tetratricopeptide (TPR) repeat protein